MATEKFSKNILSVKDRNAITEKLLSNIIFTPEEREFLKLATQEKESWSISTSNIYQSKIIEKSLENHAIAVNRSSEAANAHSKSLTIATWVLAFATVILAITSIALLCK